MIEIMMSFVAEWKKLDWKYFLSLKTSSHSQNHPSLWTSFYSWNNQFLRGVITHTIFSVERKMCFQSIGSQSFKISHLARKWKCNFSISRCRFLKGILSNAMETNPECFCGPIAHRDAQNRWKLSLKEGYNQKTRQTQ